MLLVICSAIAALACNDIERPTEIRAGSKPVAEQQAPPVISSLTCTFRRDVATISCSPALPPVAAGVSASVIYGTGTPGTAQYGIFYAVNLVKNLTTQKWSFTAYVQNLLKQSIGTLNGTTVTGVKVFVTDFHATAGTGTVSVANPDGIGTFTAPNQPYFNYNQIVAPNGYTANKVWQFNVPNTVTAVSMSILISTDFPAEQSVTLAPPTSFPDWVHADTNISARTDSVHVRFTKRILLVRFKATATLADRQLAVAVVNGAVVGGNQNPDGSGFYYVQVPDDGTGAPLFSAGRQMSKLPQVQSATPEVALDQLELKPHDGGDWQKWTLSPDSVDTSKQNWALEEIDAPYAWGCSTGDSTTKVGMVDHGFRTPNDLLANLPVASYALNPPDTGTHATQVAGVLTATGNNSIAGGSAGITGAMWRSSLQIEDALIDPSPPHHFGPGTPRELVDRVVQLAQRGVKVANISLGLVYQTKLGAYIAPSSYEDSSAAIGSMINFIDGLHDARLKGFALPLPLLVIGSGDFAQSPGTAARNRRVVVRVATIARFSWRHRVSGGSEYAQQIGRLFLRRQRNAFVCPDHGSRRQCLGSRPNEQPETELRDLAFRPVRDGSSGAAAFVRSYYRWGRSWSRTAGAETANSFWRRQ